MKTNKNRIEASIGKGFRKRLLHPKTFCNCFDGMALVRKVKHVAHIFESYADEVLKAAIFSCNSVSQINIVFGVYREKSIKNAEREHRETGRKH